MNGELWPPHWSFNRETVKIDISHLLQVQISSTMVEWMQGRQINVEVFDLLHMWLSNIADTDKEFTGSMKNK